MQALEHVERSQQAFQTQVLELNPRTLSDMFSSIFEVGPEKKNNYRSKPKSLLFCQSYTSLINIHSWTLQGIDCANGKYCMSLQAVSYKHASVMTLLDIASRMAALRWDATSQSSALLIMQFP